LALRAMLRSAYLYPLVRAIAPAPLAPRRQNGSAAAVIEISVSAVESATLDRSLIRM